MVQKKETIWEIWDFMPKRYQGMIMGFLITSIVICMNKLINLLEIGIKNNFINFIITMIPIVVIFKGALFLYPWIMEEDQIK